MAINDADPDVVRGEYTLITTEDQGRSSSSRKGRSKRTTRDRIRAEAQRKREILVECRLGGGSWSECARRAGYANTGTAYRVYHTYIESLPFEGAMRTRRTMVARFDRIIEVVWPHVLNGSPGAIDRLLATEALRSRILGLEKEPPSGGEETDVEIMALARRYSGLTAEEAEAEIRRLDWVVDPVEQEDVG